MLQEKLKEALGDMVFFTSYTPNVAELNIVPREHLKDLLKEHRKVCLDFDLCKKLARKEGRCRKFKDSCKKCIIDYWSKKTLKCPKK